jgi:IS30 family transposase
MRTLSTVAKRKRQRKRKKRQLQSMVPNKLVDNSHVDERIKNCWSSSSRVSQNSLALTVRCSPNNIYGWVQGILGSKFTSQVDELEAYRILPSL